MYKKRKKVYKLAINETIDSVCKDLLECNPNVIFLTSKSFIEKEKLEEIIKMPQIISSVPINELIIPSSIKIDENGFVRTWCDKEVLLNIFYKEITFIDGNVNEKEVNHLYLNIKD